MVVDHNSLGLVNEQVPPTEVKILGGEECAIWGQVMIQAGEEIDPPAVYAADGLIEVGEFRLDLDVAQALAERIASAVRYERGRGLNSPAAASTTGAPAGSIRSALDNYSPTD